MKKSQVKLLSDKVMDTVVGGGDAKFIATATGATVTCASSVLSAIFFIGGMACDSHHKEGLYKTAAAFGAIAVAGAISTSAISKIQWY